MNTLNDFNYSLPEHLIAQHPLPRGTSRLLHLSPPDELRDCLVADVAALFQPGDLIVVNNTRVLRARIFLERSTGGKGEVLIERLIDSHSAKGQLKMSRRPKIGEVLMICGTDIGLTVLHTEDRWIMLQSQQETFMSILENHGNLPLPPYMRRSASTEDDELYQTVFATEPGAAAAPTAGLHFTPEILKSIESRGVNKATVTLHVGSGTFLPVKSENLDQHVMHEEWFHVPDETVAAIEATKQRGGKVIAIGTTTLRALESAAQAGQLKAGAAETRLFIRPGFTFNVVDRLLTNFHLPCSTLLMLVSAFAGTNAIKQAYQHAIEKNYRFFSYGDAMLLERTLLDERAAERKHGE